MIVLSICLILHVVASVLWTMQASKTLDAQMKVIADLVIKHERLCDYYQRMENDYNVLGERTNDSFLKMGQILRDHLSTHLETSKVSPNGPEETSHSS